MQTVKLIIYWLGFLLILISCSRPERLETNAPKAQGWDVGGGGNAFAAEFLDIGRTVVRRWNGLPDKAMGHEVYGWVSLKSFEQALKTAEVKTTEEELKIEGNTVDAVNFPDKQLIVLSLKRWAKNMGFPEKRRLVIHEILGLLGKEKSLHYELTSWITGELDFYRELPIYYFMIQGKPAQTLVEKFPWLPEEISIREKYSRETVYRLSKSEKSRDKLSCVKEETLSSGKLVPEFAPRYRCYIECFYAVMSDDSSIKISLDQSGELYQRFFKGKRSFDYGLLRGEDGPEAMISVYFDR